ncbi:MAG TPA: MFS transporter [Thermomicrobiales bacterium]|nr:MFS transporter [Thermomicrobiales bacterium]
MSVAGSLSRHLYYGWVQVLTLSVTETISWGILYYAFSVFILPMEADLGWTRSQITGAFSLALIVSGIAGIPIGRWLDRHGPRALMTAGSVAATLLVLVWSQVGNLTTWYLLWVGIGVTMAATFYEPAFAMIAVWFRRKRSRALTILTFFGGFASVIFIPLSERLVQAFDWRTALVILAAILAVGTIPAHALLLRRHPADLGLRPDGELAPEPSLNRSPATADNDDEPALTWQDALRGATFWWIGGAFMLVMLAMVAVTVHLIPTLVNRGFSSGFAASAAGLVGLFALPGRLVFTPLGGRLPRQVVTALIFALEAAAIAVLAIADTRAEVIAFVVLFGSGFGAITPARAALVADVYGSRSFGTIAGVLAMLVTTARGAGPILASLLIAWWDGPTGMLWIMTALCAVGALAILFSGTGQPGRAQTR